MGTLPGWKKGMSLVNFLSCLLWVLHFYLTGAQRQKAPFVLVAQSLHTATQLSGGALGRVRSETQGDTCLSADKLLSTPEDA